MTTVINSGGGQDRDGGVGTVLAVVLVVVLIILFFVYGLPAIRGNGGNTTNIEIPDNINVDVTPDGGNGGAGAGGDAGAGGEAGGGAITQ